MSKKTGGVVSLIGGIAIIIFGIMAVLSGEPSAKGAFLWVPMLFGLYLIVSGIIALTKKQTIPQTQPLQQVKQAQPVQPAQSAK